MPSKHNCFLWCEDESCLKITLMLTLGLLEDWAIKTPSPSKRAALKLDFPWSQCFFFLHRSWENFTGALVCKYQMPDFLRPTPGNICSQTQIACHFNNNFIFELDLQKKKKKKAITHRCYVMLLITIFIPIYFESRPEFSGAERLLLLQQ